MPIEWVIPAVAVVLLLWLLSIHRRLKMLKSDAAQLWQELEARLRRRHDLVPVLVETAGQVMRPKVVQAVSDARRLAATAESPESIGKAEAALAAAIDKVLELAKARPELQADASFRRLRAEFTELEAEIVEARSLFNETVEEHNRVKSGLGGAFLSNYCFQIDRLESYSLPKAAEVIPAARRL